MSANDVLEDPTALLRTKLSTPQALGPKQRRVARFILDDEVAGAFLSAGELAERVGVDPATIVRLCQRLGYRGYPHFQDAIRRRFPRFPTFVDKVGRDGTDGNREGILARALAQDTQNLARAADSADPRAFEMLVEAVLRARRIVLVGGGVARPVVIYLFSSLGMMGYDVRDSTAGSTTLAQELALLSPDDLVIAIGFYRYLRETIEAVRSAGSFGATRAVLTDTPDSPYAELADIVLCAPVESTSHRISLVASMALANALIAALSARDGARVSAAVRRVDEQYRRAHLVLDI